MSFDRMLKRLMKERICCPKVVYEEVNAVFWEDKDPKMTKKPKIVQFLTFFCNFCQIFDKLRKLECWKCSTWHY